MIKILDFDLFDPNTHRQNQRQRPYILGPNESIESKNGGSQMDDERGTASQGQPRSILRLSQEEERQSKKEEWWSYRFASIEWCHDYAT